MPPPDPPQPEPQPEPQPGPDADQDPDLEGTITWGELAVEVADALTMGGVDHPVQAGRLMAMRACGATTSEWPTLSADLATVRGVAAIDTMTRRRLAGEPLQYVLGEWSFRHLELFVDRRVLIPRPETEVVAGLALTELHRLAPATGPRVRAASDHRVVAVDLGTGSGAIGLSLLAEHTGVEVWLTDVSSDAVAVAQANLAGLGRAAARARVATGSWFEALPDDLRGTVGLVVANPPYVADDETLPAEVADWEPHPALFSGPTGTEAVEHLIRQAPDWLHPEGALVIEMSPPQTGPMAELARIRFAEVEIEPDLTGRDRALVARHPR